MNFPMPNDVIDGEIVVASVVYIDDERGQWATTIMLAPETPFFRVRQFQYDGDVYDCQSAQAFENIVPCVREYEQMGGDW
jgi:hypothetical protein